MNDRIIQQAEHGGLLFDGAMGTLLYQRGIFLNRCFEYVNIEQPDIIRTIHRQYRDAGAQVHTTNTFGANRFRMSSHGLAHEVRNVNTRAVELARESLGKFDYVAGSVGPSGLGLKGLFGSESKRIRYAFEEQIDALLTAGVDLLVFETFDVLQELELATRLARQVSDSPIVSLIMFGEDGKTRGGGLTPQQVSPRLIEAGADIIGANCGGGPELLYRVSTAMVGHGKPVMSQPNAGQPENIEGRSIYVANPEYFGVFARRLLKAGIRVVGGCCGTTPEHIRQMSNAVRMLKGDSQPPAAIDLIELIEDRTSVPPAERSELGKRLYNGEFVTSVELNPPRGFDLSKRIKAVEELKAAGVDTINIADGPRAKVLMSNISMAREVIDKTQISPIVHVCCRDRNLLGLQSHILGMHVLGIRNLVVITGDPPKMGPFPHATGVYDLNSIGLLKLIKGFNHGIDPAGNELGEKTSFLCGTGVEPAATDLELELSRLNKKIEAGADFIMTQPVYDPAVLERFMRGLEQLPKIPILLGLCPLASARNAHFLDQNVPGMSVPQPILKRMEEADAKGCGSDEGIKIAREMLSSVRESFNGAYIMPPFSRHRMAIEVLFPSSGAESQPTVKAQLA